MVQVEVDVTGAGCWGKSDMLTVMPITLLEFMILR